MTVGEVFERTRADTLSKAIQAMYACTDDTDAETVQTGFPIALCITT